MKGIFLIIAVSLLLVGVGNQTFAQTDEINHTYTLDPVVILETDLGNLTIEFFYDDAPNHVKNFIKLSQTGFYDGTIFHRIIPDFMIQGGDPNTVSGDPSTWGMGDPNESVDAEFNTIKHNRGIVSMARAADPNSAGSQFFIVHKDSNFLDGEYTVFGRIATQESFETLDKIIAVETNDRNMPVNIEQVKIRKVTIVNGSDALNLLELPEPERAELTGMLSTGSRIVENIELGVAFSVPEGWLLQEPDGVQENTPDIVAVGPKIGTINTVISLLVRETQQRTLDELVSENVERMINFTENENFEIISQERKTINDNQAYVTVTKSAVLLNGEEIILKFKEVLIYDAEKFYTLTYVGDVDGYASQLPRFEETVDSFEIISSDPPVDKPVLVPIPVPSMNESSDLSVDKPMTEGGGCLIATAAFGSEMAPQVQQLRELRDDSLLSTQSGTAFMAGFNQLYYSFSPTIADLEREHPAFKEAVKLAITPMISSLSILNHVDMDSEAKVLGYGISLIILNLGMYFVAPAIIIYKIRK